MPRTSTRSAAERSGGEAGTGLVGTLAGVSVFLVLLLLATQVLLNLYATSTLTAAAFDAARIVAGADGTGSEVVAEEHARGVLGRFAEQVEPFEWDYVDLDGDGRADVVRLTVRAERPSRILPAGGRLPFSSIERVIDVRVEELR